MTLPGRVAIKRQRYADPAGGSVTPMAEALDTARRATSMGVAQLCCRLAIDAASFARANECLRMATGLRLSDETLRQVVQSEGKAAQAAQESEQLELDWHASDCVTQGANKQTTTRLYMGSDGFMVPTVSTAKQERDKKLKALPAMRGGSGKERFKEAKLVTFYDQGGEHRLVRVTGGDHRKAGQIMRWGLGQLRAQAAAERLAGVGGGPGGGRRGGAGVHGDHLGLLAPGRACACGPTGGVRGGGCGRRAVGRGCAADHPRAGLRSVLGPVGGTAQPAPGTGGAGGAAPADAVCGRAAADARLPAAYPARLGHRLGPDRGDVQDVGSTGEGGPTMGHGQCRGDDDPGGVAPKPSVGRLVGPPPPGRLTRPRKIGQTLHVRTCARAVEMSAR